MKETYVEDYSHSHCWDQTNEVPACGIAKEAHTRCCLCPKVKVPKPDWEKEWQELKTHCYMGKNDEGNIKIFIRSLLASHESPMGVSQWMNYGDQYGYSKFWKDKIEASTRQSEREAILEMIEGMRITQLWNTKHGSKEWDVAVAHNLALDSLAHKIKERK